MRNVQEIVFVTSNDDKAREAEHVLGFAVKRVKLELDEIQSMDLKAVVEHKVRQAYGKLRRAVLVEDVGFYIKQWNGFPGPLVKWLQETMGYAMLTKILDKKDRSAKWQVTYAFFDGKTCKVFTGAVSGAIANKPRGKNGWGFDTIFIPKGYNQTYAEMDYAEKMKISARKQALLKAAKFLKNNH